MMNHSTDVSFPQHSSSPAHAACSPGDWCAQVYKAMRRHVQECAVKILRNVNEDELTNFQRVCVCDIACFGFRGYHACW